MELVWQERFSVAVIGCGTMGAAACMHLAQRGVRVLGLDAHPVPHPHGSHHGGSRIIRDCYFEHPDYVPLLLRCRALWDALERESGIRCVHRPGVLYLGPPGSAVVERSADSGAAHGIPAHRWTMRDVAAHFPQFRAPDDWVALFEPGAGFVRPERAVEAFLRVARAHGAAIHESEPVLGWDETAHGVRVRTARATYEADALVITAGAWTPKLAAQLGVPLQPLRIPIAWLAPRDPAACESPRMPVWYVDRPHGAPGVYGIPTAPDQGTPVGVKVALHGAGTPCDPSAPRPPATPDELDAIRAATEPFVPCAAGAPIAGSTCLYTMSPDEHFVVDRMPGCARTWVACGFSGHGFKFAPVLGQALADLATEGRTPLPVGFLGLQRLRNAVR